jgi:aryl-alcohol dehydrogenase-like predicted oxidoreductase
VRYVEVAGARVSAIGLGTWQFGSAEWGYGVEYASTEAVRIVERALDLGINLIDSAEVYAFGQSERIVGAALGERRDEAFVATKIFPVVPVARVVEARARASADRLGVTIIDLYQLHWPNPVFPLAGTMSAMGALVDTGLVRHVGVSNFSAARWRQAETTLGAPVLSNQVQYSLARRNAEDEVLPYACSADRLVIAYSPLAQGLLSGKHRPGSAPGGIRAANPLFLPENLERAVGLLAALEEVGAANGATSAQVALAWVIRRPNVVAIPGASSVAQLEANAAAADLDLSDDEDVRLTEASDRFRPLKGPATWTRLARARLAR